MTLTYGFVYEDWNLQERWWALKWEAPWNFRLVPRGLSIGLPLWLLRQVGPVPVWFHAMCLSVHLVNVLLLFGIARRALPSIPAALAAALFAIHPVQIESVAYLSALPDLVSTTMILFGLWALERRYFVLACLTCGLAVWAKEMAGVVVLLLPLWSLYRGIRWPEPMRAVWAFGAAVGLWLLSSRFAIHPELGPQLGVGLAQFGSLLSLVVWPFGRLTVDHDWRWITSDVVAWAVVGLFAALVFTPKRWASPVTFALLWVLCAVLPRFLVPLSEGMHEHHLYLPMVGLSMAFGAWTAQGALPIADPPMELLAFKGKTASYRMSLEGPRVLASKA